MPITCKECKKGFPSVRGLSTHLRLSHKVNLKSYTVTYEHGGIQPLCLCGCMQPVKFTNGTFDKYIFKHHYNDPLNVARRSNSHKASWTDDEVRKKKQSDRMHSMWADAVKANKISSSMRIAWSDESLKKEHRERMKARSKDERYREKLRTASRSAVKKGHATRKRNNSYGKSRAEDRFYASLLDFFVHEDIERHTIINGWNIDFHIKSIDTYIQFDGAYYHGTGRTLVEVAEFKTATDRTIHGTMLRDIAQNEWFSSNGLKLFRPKELEFKEAWRTKNVPAFIIGIVGDIALNSSVSG